LRMFCDIIKNKIVTIGREEETQPK